MSRNTAQGRAAHERCDEQGGGHRANPNKEFQPCPCRCQCEAGDGMLDNYECGSWGGEIVGAPLWPFDEDGDVRYTHIDRETDRATGEECPERPAPKTRAKQTEEFDESRDCIRCGSAFTSSAGSRVCAYCLRVEEQERAAETAAEDDFSDLDDLDEDDFADLDDL